MPSATSTAIQGLPDAADPPHPEQAPRRWTHARVHSSYASGRFDDGLLRLRFDFEDAERIRTRLRRVWFEVPSDFHAHNDSVAAALMTLLSTSAGAVSFNFAISEHCATLLRDYYRLTDVGPVDPALEPRRPGRWPALNFSGGLDSFAAMTLLDELLPGDYKVITSAYGEGYAHEARGYEPYHRDVTCRTNFREQRRFSHGRFNAAVPLLFADYLDLESLTTGHGFSQEPLSIDPLIDDSPPRFRIQEAALEAGGLHELHLMRGLMEPGNVKAVRHLPADQLEAAFIGSGGPSSSKFTVRGAILRHMLEAEGHDVPSFLHGLVFRPGVSLFGRSLGGMLNLLYLAKHIGIEPLIEYSSGIDRIDPAWLEHLSLDFLTKYNPNYIGLLPGELRAPLLATLSWRGIEPYNERDWRELDAVREYFYALQTAG